MECKHLLESGCTYCSHKETTFVPAKAIKVAKARTRARIDRDMVIAELVAKGELCEHCLTPTGIKRRVDRAGIEHIDHNGIGCHCSRRAFFADQVGNTGNGAIGSDSNAGITQLWLQDNVDAFIPQECDDTARAIRSAEKVVTGLAFSTLTRASRRAGIVRDAGVRDGEYDPRDTSEAADFRDDVLVRFGVDPTWHAPRTQEADYSPV